MRNGISATRASNITALHQKKRIFDTNYVVLHVVGNAAEAFGIRSMCGSGFGGESDEKRYAAHMPDKLVSVYKARGKQGLTKFLRLDRATALAGRWFSAPRRDLRVEWRGR